ncbi:MAG: hypothetical protein J6V98_02160 [Bacteroidales bacterium]|nr:hypothetical protein [Bacteroidales bacterium]
MNIHRLLTTFALSLLLLVGGSATAVAQTGVEQQHYRFLQRLTEGYAQGEIQGKPVDTYLREEKIAFLQGGFSQLQAALADSAAIEISLVDGKRYAVSFFRGDQRTVIISYPASYQLILGTTLMEAENRLFEDVWRTPLPKVEEHQVVEELLQQMGTSAVYLLAGSSYVLPELNTNRYYVKNEHGKFELLYSEDLPLETMANLTTGTDIDNQLMLDIRMVKYGYRTEDATVPLRQWVAFGIEQGCTPFFGVISSEEGKVVCEYVMQNEALGYAHVMKFEFNPSILVDRKGNMSARLNSYVPISNVKSLFKENEYK